ncbi:MAG TPA: IPT/TIG domain-containing protein [Solirubrobacteraceae bacterium]|nr:IPT/TIG domain-containing protein [Solirubrobacteraceae bacterium]
MIAGSLIAVLALAWPALGGSPAAAAAPVTLRGLAPVTPGGGSSPTSAQIRSAKGRVRGISLTPSATEPRWACPESLCEALIAPRPLAAVIGGRRRFRSAASGRLLEGSGVEGGYDPEDLQSAYDIPVSAGEPQTVAVVDAHGYSTAEQDLAVYRQKYGLPPCTKANGCFHRINQHGEEANYPPDEPDWDGEAALDIEMVSAACPSCHIIQAEANEAYDEDLGEAVDSAARDGANEISASYGSAESYCEPECEVPGAAYDLPGVMVFVSGGDGAYDNNRRGSESPNFPADLPWVVAVGGTELLKATDARGWEDTVWTDGGSGCSTSIAKPAWQSDPACPHRMAVDVAADASCESPLSTYDHYEGWDLVCGTSASSPLLAGIEAHADAQTRSLPGADAFYEDPGALSDVTRGSNGTCTPPTRDAYFCTAGPGYDGPTGNGVPDGALGVSQPPPSVRTTSASSVTGTGAVLNGALDPQGTPTTYQFEYGSSTAYGSTTPVSEPQSGSASVNASAAVEGLEPGRVYHFRLVATNAAGTSYGADQIFATEVPSVTSISPADGPADGGTTVTISGSGFDAASSVHFGIREVADFNVESNETITVEAPFGAGSAAVTVTTPAGTSATDPAATFTWAKAGSVFGWGYDSGGQLGNGSQARAVDDPVEVRGLREAVQLASANTESLALMGDGTVMGWGSWGSAIGDGAAYDEGSDVPVEVCAVATKGECPHGPYLQEAVAVAAGRFFGLALLKDGRVVSWGSDDQGELGRPQERFSEVNGQDYTPGYVCTHTSGSPGECKGGHYLQEVVAIAAGRNFALALLKDGKVMAWGADDEGQLASEKRIRTKCEVARGKATPCSQVPVPVSGLSEVTEISAGDDHSLALERDGTVKAWGSDSLGELGVGTVAAETDPLPVCAAGRRTPCGQLEDVVGISAGDAMSTAVLGDGSVVDWGLNADGSLGDGSFAGPETCTIEEEGEVEQLPCSSVPVPVVGLANVREAKTGVDDYDVLALTDGGELWSWGSDQVGGLGIGEPFSRDVPTRVCAPLNYGPCPEGPYLEGEVTSFAVGGFHDLLSLTIAEAIVSSVSPDEGPGAGGTAVTITGTGFTPATAVEFGTHPASSFEVRSGTEIVAVAPPGSGTVDVTVSTPDGPSEVRLADRFTYVGSTVTSLDPHVGPGSGGTSVAITGTKLTGASAVEFGGTPAESFEVRSPGEIVAVSPSGTGTVQVTVTTPEGVTAEGEDARFTYESAPAVTTSEVSELTRQTVRLNGEVNPNLSKIKACRFEWGLGEAYEHSITCKGAGNSAEGDTATYVYREMTGLKTATTYHYRVVAENAYGVGYGSERAFTTLAAELPELGRCQQLSSPLGSYDSETCTTESPPGEGGYEWDQGPGPAAGFTASARKIKLQQPDGGITCTEGRASGEYTGAWSATMHLQLKGCEASGEISGTEVSGRCQTEAAPAGEIDSEPLGGLLAWTKRKTAKVGWSFHSLSEAWVDVFWAPIAFVTCGGTPVTIVGGFGGELKKGLDAPVTSSTLHLGAETEQGGSGSPSLLTGGTEPVKATLKGTFTLVGEEPIEVKTTR